MSLGLKSAALLVVLNLLAGNLGDLSPQFGNFAALAVWAPVQLSLFWPKFREANSPRKVLTLALLVVALLSFAAGGVHAMFALVITLWCAYLLAKDAIGPPGLQLLLSVAAGTGLWSIGQDVLPQAMTLLQTASALSCRASSFLAASPIEFGPTYSGVPILITLVILDVSILALSRPQRPLLLVGVLSAQAILLLAYQIAFHFLLKNWQVESHWMVLGAAQWGLLLLGLIPALIQLRVSVIEPGVWAIPRRSVAWLAATAVVVFIAVADRLYPVLAAHARPKVLLYDDGTLDWSVPVYGQYSGIRGGMFGALGPFLQRHQCDAWRGSLTNGALRKANVMVVFNLMRKFTPEEKRQIWQFVAQGGSLLAVGDHTGTTQIREPFNDLLEPVDIGFNFDSAMPIRRKWTNGLRCFPHPATANLRSTLDAQIQVGASLTVGAPATPLIIGTHGWSDKGNLENPTSGYLGDRLYSTDERLGDVVLVATAKYHRGKVMVFGDTTTLQNSATARAGQFVQAIFRSLTLREVPWLRFSITLLAFAGIGGALWTLLRAKACAASALTFGYAGIYLGCAAGVLAGRVAAQSLAVPSPPGEAVIDTAHLSRCDPELWWPDGLGGLVQNLMRKNYEPTVMPVFSPELIRRSKVCFLVAPAKSFSHTELATYEKFVRDGGHLYVCAGYEEANGSRALLQQFGLRLRNLPLGAIGPEGNDAKIHFLGAWPIAAEPGQTEILCRQGEYPLIVARSYGKGKVVLAGDSAFFLNRDLEMAEAFNLENIEFFHKLVPAHD